MTRRNIIFQFFTSNVALYLLKLCESMFYSCVKVNWVVLVFTLEMLSQIPKDLGRKLFILFTKDAICSRFVSTLPLGCRLLLENWRQMGKSTSEVLLHVGYGNLICSHQHNISLIVRSLCQI